MATFEIPLSPNPQSLDVTLGSVTYQMTVRWNVFTTSWILDVADNTGNMIVSSVPLVTGVNLLGQYGYLNFGGDLFAFTDRDLDAPPTFDNIGSTGHLYFFVRT